MPSLPRKLLERRKSHVRQILIILVINFHQFATIFHYKCQSHVVYRERMETAINAISYIILLLEVKFMMRAQLTYVHM